MVTASIRTHLLWLVLAASIPLVAAGVFNVSDELRSGEAQARTKLRTLASAMVSHTGEQLSDARLALEQLGALAFSTQLDPDDCARELKGLTLGQPHYLDVFTTDPEGQVKCAASGRQGAVAGASWFQDFQRAPTFSVGLPHLDPLTGRQVSVISVPLAQRGALHLVVDLAVFDAAIPAQLLPPESRSGFYAADGVVMWRSADAEHAIGTRPDAEVSRQVLQVRQGEFEAHALDGVLRLYAAAPMPLTGWIAYVGVPLSSVHAGLAQSVKRSALAALAAILFLVLAAVVVAKRIADPIAELERVARAVHGGDLGVKAPVGGPRDIAEVALALNAMVAARQRSEEELLAFLENSAVIAWLKDEQGRVVFVSRNYLKRFALKSEQVVGRTDQDVWPPELAERFRRSDQQLLASGAPMEVVEQMTNPDGSTSSWLTNKFVFQGSDGRRLVGGLAVDVTAIEQAEQAQRVSDAQLNQAFDASPIGMALVSLEGRFLRVNGVFCSMLGRSEAELLASGFAAITNPSDLPEGQRAVKELIAGERPTYEAEKRYLHQDGHQVWAQLNVSVVRDARGHPLHCVAQIQDISQRKTAEASARLAVVGTLAAGAAHEINNPLTYVLGNLSWVEEELRGLRASLLPAQQGKLEEALEALAEAHGGAQRIAGIIAGLKTFSRKSDVTMGPTHVGKVMESALQLTHTQRRNQAVTVSRISEAPLVLASARQLEQVFINLLVNAAQAIPEGAAASHRITVSVREGEHGEVVAEVQDTGVGITAAVRPHLFEPFFTTKPVGAGTGLGLPTCHGIVTSLGGRIEVESEPGQGSTFRVILPGLPGDTSTPHTPAPEPLAPLPTGHRVLVVDDDPAVARGIARSLRGGPEVVMVHDSREALRQLERGEHYDLVVCDLMMPSLSGEEFQKQLQPLRPGLAQSMLFVTGGAFTPSATAFLQTTRNKWLQKPVDNNVLRRLVAERLGQDAGA